MRIDPRSWKPAELETGNGELGIDNWEPRTAFYCFFAFLIRPRPAALRPTLDGGLRAPSSSSFSTTALFRSSLRDAYSSVSFLPDCAKACNFSRAVLASRETSSFSYRLRKNSQ